MRTNMSPQDREVRETYLSLSCKLKARIPHCRLTKNNFGFTKTPGHTVGSCKLHIQQH